MILAAVDDLLFSSKIRTVAKQAGVEVVFARTPAAIVEEARARQPALIIFDLNSAATNPLATVRALAQDPALAAIRTIGFVSHVQVDLIQQAREAGVGELMPRSAFAANLATLLAGGDQKDINREIRRSGGGDRE